LNGGSPKAAPAAATAAAAAAATAAGHAAAATAVPGDAAEQAEDSSVSSPAVSESWQVLGALGSLRAGSASLFSSAAQQLRLRQRTQQQQQQQQQQAPGKAATAAKGPSCLSNMSRATVAAAENGVFAEAPASPADMARQFSRFAGQPPAADHDSGYCRQQQLMRWQQSLQQQQQDQQQQQPAAADTASLEHSVVDFLDRFTVNFMAVNFGSLAAAEQGNVASWKVPSGRESMRVDTPTTPAGTPLAAAGSWGSSNITLATLQQHQLAVTYVQQPPGAMQQPQQLEDDTTSPRPPEDSLSVFLAHLKVTLGPHSVSMLLQLLTSVTAAASSQHEGSSRQAAGAKQQPAGARTIAGSSNSSAKGAGSASRLHMQLQAALCHVRLNMERPYWLDMSKAEVRARAARERKEKQKAEQQQTNDAEQEQGDDAQQFQIDDTPMRTKDLLALLVLGTNTSVRKLPAAASSSSGRDGAGTGAAAGADVAQPGMEVAFCVAHIGLQDLRACVEQRHVLSGALEPYQVRSLKQTNGAGPACYTKSMRIHCKDSIALRTSCFCTSSAAECSCMDSSMGGLWLLCTASALYAAVFPCAGLQPEHPCQLPPP
jgi:hypothetical protein